MKKIAEYGNLVVWEDGRGEIFIDNKISKVRIRVSTVTGGLIVSTHAMSGNKTETVLQILAV
jgi:hypothetical protein